MSVIAVIALFLSAFVLWRKSREEHYSEDQVFDLFLLSSLLGVVGARVGYIVFNFNQFGFSLVAWLDIVSNAGFSGSIGLLAAGWYVARYALKKKWDRFEVLDFWMISVSLGLSIVSFGQFLDGSGAGYPTSLPIGITFPGLFEAVHPVQLYHAAFFLALYVYLSRVELQYRNFQWYRSGKKSAQTGFLLSTAAIGSGIFFFLVSFLKPATVHIFDTNIDRVFALVLFIGGLLVLYHRSGRPLPFTREKKKKAKLARRFEAS